MSLSVEVISHNDAKTVTRLIEIDKSAFGVSSLSIWEIVPFIRHGLVVALNNNSVTVGDALFMRDWQEPTRAYLFSVAIDPAYRGKGFGTFLLSECFKKLKNEGIRCVELTVDASNTAAVRVYKDKLGFITTELRTAEYGHGEDRLVMVKTLHTSK